MITLKCNEFQNLKEFVYFRGVMAILLYFQTAICAINIYLKALFTMFTYRIQVKALCHAVGQHQETVTHWSHGQFI